MDRAFVKKSFLQCDTGGLLFRDEFVDGGEGVFRLAATAAHGCLEFGLEPHAVFESGKLGLESGFVVGVQLDDLRHHVAVSLERHLVVHERQSLGEQLGLLRAVSFFGFGKRRVALGQCAELILQVGHIFFRRVAAVADRLVVRAALGVGEEDGRHTLDAVLGAQGFVLLDLLRRLLGLVARAVELEQDEALGHLRLEDILDQHVFVQRLAGRAPVRAGELHEDAFALLGGLGLGFLEIHNPAFGGLCGDGQGQNCSGSNAQKDVPRNES